MGALPSKRLRHHVIYHCPACFADRVGALRSGSWRHWPSDVVQRGTFIECTACQAQTSG